jgi:hypothetical protein
MRFDGVKVGDLLYCHTTGYMNNTNDCFAVEGKYYPITGVMSGMVYMTNERGCKNHVWPDNHIFDKYFTIHKVLIKRGYIRELQFI